jgi:hypothetical protein
MASSSLVMGLETRALVSVTHKLTDYNKKKGKLLKYPY